MQVPFVDLKAQYLTIKEEVDAAILNVLASTQFILGEEVKLFEEEFAAFCGSKYAIGVASGTDALHLALRACGIGPGDEVIVPSNTFIATALAVSYSGASVRFCDVNEDTLLMDVKNVEKAVTDKTRAIIPVHLYGQCVDMDPIVEFAKQNRLIVIEDACQAHGALYKDRKAGSLGKIGCFSFYPGKNLGAYGDGGMAVTDDEEITRRLRCLRNYGSEIKYYHPEKGFNSRLDTVQASVLRIKLRKLEGWNSRRYEIAQLYREGLAGSNIRHVQETGCGTHVYHLFVVRVGDRDRVADSLKTKGIQPVIHYPIPIHLQDAYRDSGMGKGSFPVTEKAAGEILSLPMFPELTDDQANHVISVLLDSLAP